MPWKKMPKTYCPSEWRHGFCIGFTTALFILGIACSVMAK